jgi:hypothetical protein
MALKDAYLARLKRKQDAEEAAARPYQEAHARLKALFHEIMADREMRDFIRGEVELNDDELQIDPGPILIRATVDEAGDYHLTYEIKSHDDPEIVTLPVRSIPDIEEAVASLLVDYSNGRVWSGK